ncbi:REP-associated tyrosine transposase [Roseicyclus persicicus]|uniref:Transposase n=1 Tax=Roseicyclus persicicus TaxID=2650661 RepID=A0A7X6JY34_9RHOB|nr:transposase [Roseibacterium persicicum]NKX43408.1 transposase [Roseibacterium persicicum]
MSVYRRPAVTGARVFFTVTLAARGGDLLVREVELLREAVRVTKAERPFGIEAWVVLPDHLHAVWQMPAGDRAYGVRWGAIKARFTRAVREKGCRVGFHPTDGAPVGPGMVGWNPTLRSASKVRKGDAGLWQRRFWEHHIRDEADYWAHVRYCWVNPVKHGFVARPEDWPWSSVHQDGRYVPGIWLGM